MVVGGVLAIHPSASRRGYPPLRQHQGQALRVRASPAALTLPTFRALCRHAEPNGSLCAARAPCSKHNPCLATCRSSLISRTKVWSSLMMASHPFTSTYVIKYRPFAIENADSAHNGRPSPKSVPAPSREDRSTRTAQHRVSLGEVFPFGRDGVSAAVVISPQKAIREIRARDPEPTLKTTASRLNCPTARQDHSGGACGG